MKRLLFLLVIVPSVAFADRWDAAVSQNAGNYIETSFVDASTTTATLIVNADTAVKSANIAIFNNSALTIWIGTNTATLQTSGFPILSSTTYKLDGSYTGSIYALGNAGAVATGNVRTIYYLKRDALQ